jgi:hypothetical protein
MLFEFFNHVLFNHYSFVFDKLFLFYSLNFTQFFNCVLFALFNHLLISVLLNFSYFLLDSLN